MSFTKEPVALADLKRFAAARGKSWTDPRIQVQFMLSRVSDG